MELPKTLENLLGCLLSENGLVSWQIFEEKSSHVVVKIRFANGHCDPKAERQPTETVTAYKRKSPSQVKRDQARVAAHKRQQSTAPRMTTRSMAAVCLQSEPCAGDLKTDANDTEQLRCGDDPQSEHSLGILVLPLQSPRDIRDISLLSTENDSESPRDVAGKHCIPSISSGDRTVTTPVLASNVNAREAPDDQPYLALDDSSAIVEPGDCGNVFSNMDLPHSESCSDDDLSIPDVAPGGMDSLLDLLRTEIRGIVPSAHQ
jgi:hypothetical protein